MRKRGVEILLLCLALCVPAAVASAKVNIYFIPKVTGSAAGEAACLAAQAFAEENGFILTLPDVEKPTAAAQVSAIRAAVNNGADGICIDVADAAGVDAALKDEAAGGLIVTTWDSDAAADARALAVSQGTPEELGRMLADLLAASLAERGKDAEKDEIRYCWHCGLEKNAAEAARRAAGEAYIAEKYPNWINVAPDSYYCKLDREKAAATGEAILAAHPDIDGVICSDPVSLEGQAKALQNLGLGMQQVTVTGFGTPNAMKPYLAEGILSRFGLWDARRQAVLACYLTHARIFGEEIAPGDTKEAPGLGTFEVLPDTALDEEADDSRGGVVLLPERPVLTAENIDNYDF